MPQRARAGPRHRRGRRAAGSPRRVVARSAAARAEAAPPRAPVFGPSCASTRLAAFAVRDEQQAPDRSERHGSAGRHRRPGDPAATSARSDTRIRIGMYPRQPCRQRGELRLRLPHLDAGARRATAWKMRKARFWSCPFASVIEKPMPVHSWKAPDGNPNRRGITPMTVYAVPVSRTVRPTTCGFPPNRRCHSP